MRGRGAVAFLEKRERENKHVGMSVCGGDTGVVKVLLLFFYFFFSGV